LPPDLVIIRIAMKASRRINSARATAGLAAVTAVVALAALGTLRAAGQPETGHGDPALEAEEALLAAVERSEQPPADAGRLGTSLRNLGSFYFAAGRTAEARPLLERALVVREKGLGRSHPDVLQSLGDLAMLESSDGNVARAERLYKRVLGVQRRLYGRDDVRTAITINNLALLAVKRGDAPRAVALYEDELELLEQAYGADSVRLVSTLDTLAGLAARQARDADAEALYRRAITLAEGSDAPASARRLRELLEHYAALLAGQPGRSADVAMLERRIAELQAQTPSIDRRATTE
jgi:tetratricopeptide (TPR) repeat protein